MKRSSTWVRWPLIVGVVLTTSACATLWNKLVPRRDEIKVAHARHKQAKVECIGCHEDIFDVEELGASTLPNEKKCFECHKKERDAKDCAFCHTDPQQPLTYFKRAFELKMSHQKHLEMEKVEEDCGVCHQKLSDVGAPRRSTTPMGKCLTCHEHKEEYDEATCGACHEDLGRYPLRPISAYSHQGDYLRDHGRQAETSGQSCALCHDQSFCADCHASTVATRLEVRIPDRPDRQFIHFGNYLSRHSIEARAESRGTCFKCHGQSSCEDCHREQGLSDDGTLRNSEMNPHPRGFNTPGSPDFHGPAARRDIGSCATCHDRGAASNCVECHAVGGIGGTPHPANWGSRHRLDDINRNSMCLACHR